VYLKGSTMSEHVRASRISYLIFLMLASCVPAIAQHASDLGGSFNDPVGMGASSVTGSGYRIDCVFE
jgi:hypothetical protein